MCLPLETQMKLKNNMIVFWLPVFVTSSKHGRRRRSTSSPEPAKACLGVSCSGWKASSPGRQASSWGGLRQADWRPVQVGCGQSRPNDVQAKSKRPQSRPLGLPLNAITSSPVQA